jgi:putative NADH-flavin reductase
MKVVILGATGGTGRELVKQALELGHDVTAFVRDPSKLKIKDEKLTVVQGDMLDPATLDKAIAGQDAVICALGVAGLGKSTDLSEGTANVIRAMDRSCVKRFILESTVGIEDSTNHAPWIARKFFFPFVLKNIVPEKVRQERLTKASDLVWTIVRPGRLTNGPRTGKYRIGDEINEKSVSGTISRADTADFILKQLSDDSYLRKTPAVSY